MKLRLLLVPALVVVPVVPVALGGWAVVTVENPPEALVAGVPYEMEYTVRQHGVTLVSDMKGRVEAVSGSRRVMADARGGAPGKYTARLTIPEPGDWTITVHSGFGPGKTTMVPLRVAKAGRPVAVMPEAERGRHLFASKGCMVCHVELKVAPDPRDGEYDAAFVRQILADPRSVPRRRATGPEMPNLGLKPAEIAALTAYLAGPNSAGSR